MTYRSITLTDAADIYGLITANADDSSHATPDFYTISMLSEHCGKLSLLAERNGHLSGIALVLPGKADGTAVLFLFLVDSPQRRAGIGTELFNRLREHLRLNGYTRLVLRVLDTNIAASRFWRQTGFQPSAEQPLLSDSSHPELMMERAL